MAPRGRPRHQRFWASDTGRTFIAAVVVIIVYLIWEGVGTAPQGMVTLVGLAGGALFGAATRDHGKRQADTEAAAERAEAKADDANTKADALTRVAEREHPDQTAAEKPPLSDGGEGR